MISHNYRILQWNINGYYSKLHELQILIKTITPAVICLQETNFKKDYVASLTNYNSYHKNRERGNRASGGAAIYVHKSYPSVSIPINSKLEVTATKITFKKHITICNLYLPNSQVINKQDIIQIINQLPTPFIFLGDINAHNTMWGSEKTDTRGKLIEDILDNDELILLNNGKPTHFNQYNGNTSAIDLSIASSSIATYLEWDVLDEIHSSDHWPITIDIKFDNNQNPGETNNRWRLKDANWQMYSEIFNNEIENIENSITVNSDINDDVATFTNAIIHAAHSAIGKTQYKGKRSPVPWWNSECDNIVKEKKQAFNKFKKNKSPGNLIAFKKIRAKARNILKTSKINSWRNFTTSITSQSSPKELWTKIKKFKGSAS